MKRRDFIIGATCGVGAAWIGYQGLARAIDIDTMPPLPRKFTAADTVTLGKTGITTSRLAMGTGTVGSGHHSHQTALGVKGLSDLLLNGHDNGLRFFDAADAYGSHPHVAEALKHIPRDKVTVLTKTWARDPPSPRRSRPLSQRTGNRLSGHLPDALPHRRRLDGALPGRDGCVFRSQAEKASSAATDVRATASRRCARRPSHHGWKSTWCASIRLARTWTPILKRSSACCAK